MGAGKTLEPQILHPKRWSPHPLPTATGWVGTHPPPPPLFKEIPGSLRGDQQTNLAFPGVGIGVGLTNGLLIGVWLDGKLGLAERNEARRARAAREVAVKLGPTFIKLGQALSIRCGLVSCPALSQARGDTPGR